MNEIIEILGGNLLSAFCCGLSVGGFVISIIQQNYKRELFFTVMIALTAIGALT